MLPKDFIYNSTFKDLMSKGLNQKQAGDGAARVVHLWAHGREYKSSLKKVMSELSPELKEAKKKLKVKRLIA